MSAILLALLLSHTPAELKPILSLNLDGSITAPTSARFRPGTKFVTVPGGVGVNFEGVLSGISLPESPIYAPRPSFSVSVWLKPEAFVTRGPGAQVLFHGDDRPGIDPYSLVIHPDERIYFAVQNERQDCCYVASPIRLGRWTHVLGSFDGFCGVMRLFIDGKLVQTMLTNIRPEVKLLSAEGAGVGIGNVQWDRGPHNQPLTGSIADLRLYAQDLRPKDVGFDPSGWNQPWRSE
jgi:hypothetical protein